MPSVYFSNSQTRRDLPTPASPTTVTSRAVPRSTVSCSIALTSANSVSRPTNAGSSPSPRRWLPRIPATTRNGPPQVERIGLALRRVLAGVLVGERLLGQGPGHVVDQDGARLRGRLHPGRGVDPVTDDQPLGRVCDRRRVPGDDTAARLQGGDAGLLAEDRDLRDELQGRAHRPFRVVLEGDR